MVDTLIASDLCAASIDPEVARIVVVSDDTDFVPPMILARTLGGASLIALSPDGLLDQSIRQLLTGQGIEVQIMTEGAEV